MKGNLPSCRCFALIETLLIISIVGILAGIVLPSFFKGKAKAEEKNRYVKWLNYNAAFNHDPDTVINFNCEKAPYYIVNNKNRIEAVKNEAQACNAKNFSSSKYYGIMHNSPEWVKNGGRWPFKNAIQFDGHKQYIELANSFIVDFDPTKNAFSVIIWVNFYSTKNQYLFSKGSSVNKLQYGCYLREECIGAGVGGSHQIWTTPKIKTMRWYQIVLVHSPDTGYQIYVDGKMATNPSKKHKKVKQITFRRSMLELCTLKTNRPTQLFRGRIDEFILLKRALSEQEIKQNYFTGNPY